jgi:beta-glucosidase
MVTDAGDPIVAEGQYTVWIGGGQPGTNAQGQQKAFEIKGKLALPE